MANISQELWNQQLLYDFFPDMKLQYYSADMFVSNFMMPSYKSSQYRKIWRHLVEDINSHFIFIVKYYCLRFVNISPFYDLFIDVSILRVCRIVVNRTDSRFPHDQRQHELFPLLWCSLLLSLTTDNLLGSCMINSVLLVFGVEMLFATLLSAVKVIRYWIDCQIT